MRYKYAGAVYSGNMLVGFVGGNVMKEIKRQASRMCNRHYCADDRMFLHRNEDNRRVGTIILTRQNHLKYNGEIVRGQWR